MKQKRPLSLLSLALLIAYSTSAFAGPPRLVSPVAVNGTHAYLQAFTDGQPYTCDYTVVGQLASGGTKAYSGQSQPTTNGGPISVADVDFKVAINSATVTQWNCTPQ